MANISEEQVQRAARNSIPMTLTTYTLPQETEEYFDQVLGMFLTQFHQDEIKDALAYCLRELAVNAKKANTKRVYFEERGLDLDNREDYESGMEGFKQDTLGNIDHYLQKQKDAGLYIKVVFHAQGNSFRVSVRNNAEITKKEQIRIFDRIARSRAFDSIEEAFSTVLDSSEGAGLGIVILILMLEKIGLDEDAFNIESDDGETIASITVPFANVHLDKMDALTNQIVSEVDSLPQFPESIMLLQKLIDDPESEISDVARNIAQDPVLTADLLKMVNSAEFMMPRKVDNIVDAVKTVGLRRLKNLLYSYGTQKVLGERYSDMRTMWHHSRRAAFYACTISRIFKHTRELQDDIYVGGMLHDLGQIVVSSLHPDLLGKIRKFTTEKGIGAKMLEDFSVGLNHAEVGALIAHKWNFPEPLIESIRFHHEPLSCSDEYRDVVFTVYLANALCDIERDQLTYDQLAEGVLADFNISSKQQLMGVLGRLQDAFQTTIGTAVE